MSILKSTQSLKPKRSLGQNFLIQPHYQRKIVSEIERDYSGETVIEIGPGRGALTEHLLSFVKKLILIEKDDELAHFWQARLQQQPQHRVVRADALDWDFADMPDDKVCVVGNLPYNVATLILQKFLQDGSRFSKLTFMLQKEVAQKCMATPNHKNYGPLSVACQWQSRIYKVCDVPPTAFKPKPRVDSQVLTFFPVVTPDEISKEHFFGFVKTIFSQRRKMLGGLLHKNGWVLKNLATNDPVLSKRAEQLSVAQMIDVYSRVNLAVK